MPPTDELNFSDLTEGLQPRANPDFSDLTKDLKPNELDFSDLTTGLTPIPTPRKAGGFGTELLKATGRGIVRGSETGLKAMRLGEKAPEEEPVDYPKSIWADIKRTAFSIPEKISEGVEYAGEKIIAPILKEGKLGKPLGEAITSVGKEAKEYWKGKKEEVPATGSYITSPLIKKLQDLQKDPSISMPENLSPFLKGYESTVHSLTSTLPAAAIGAVSPSGKAMLVKAMAGGILGGGTIFGASKYDEVMEMGRLYAPNMPEKELKRLALEAGLWEGVTETALDVAVGKFLGLLGADVSTPIKETIKKTLKPSIVKQFVKNVAKITPIELTEEKIQEAGDVRTHKILGAPFEKDKDLVSTVTVSSILFAALGVGGQRYKANAALKTLSNPDAKIEDRAGLVNEVASAMFKKDKEAAINWVTKAQEAVYNKQPIDINEKVFNGRRINLDQLETTGEPIDLLADEVIDDKTVLAEEAIQGDAFDPESYPEIEKEVAREAKQKEYEDILAEHDKGGFAEPSKGLYKGIGKTIGIDAHTGLPIIDRTQKEVVTGERESGDGIKGTESGVSDAENVGDVGEGKTNEKGNVQAQGRYEKGQDVAELSSTAKEPSVSLPEQAAPPLFHYAEQEITGDTLKAGQPHEQNYFGDAVYLTEKNRYPGKFEYKAQIPEDLKILDLTSDEAYENFRDVVSKKIGIEVKRSGLSLYDDLRETAAFSANETKTNKAIRKAVAELTKDYDAIKAPYFSAIKGEESFELVIKNREIPIVTADAKTREAQKGQTEIGEGEGKLSVSPEKARKINMKTELPKTPEFIEAVRNTPSARIEDDGLLIKIQRGQKIEQALMPSVRGGVMYLPEGSKQAKYYTTGKYGYGGTEKITGETLLRRPLFVKGATGGKAIEAAYDFLKGKNAYQEMRKDALKALGTIIYSKSFEKEKAINLFLEKYTPEFEIDASYILSVSKEGNQLPYALQEAAVAHAVREAGYDSVLGYSKTRKDNKLFISEIFDVRESHYPDKFGTSKIFDKFTEGQPMFKLGKPSPEALTSAEDVIKNVFARVDTILGKGTVSVGFKPSASILDALSTNVKEKALGEHGLSLSDKFEVAGFYQHKHTLTGNGLKHIITFAEELKSNPKNLEKTAYHEPYHGVKEILRQQAKQGNKDAQAILDTLKAEFKGEEAEAEAFALYGMKEADTRLSAKVRAIFERIMRFFRQLGDYLTGKGITSKAEVRAFFEKVWTGEFADKMGIEGESSIALAIKQDINPDNFDTSIGKSAAKTYQAMIDYFRKTPRTENRLENNLRNNAYDFANLIIKELSMPELKRLSKSDWYLKNVTTDILNQAQELSDKVDRFKAGELIEKISTLKQALHSELKSSTVLADRFEGLWDEFSSLSYMDVSLSAIKGDEFADFKKSMDAGKFESVSEKEISNYTELLKKDYDSLSDKERNIVNNLMADEGMLSIKKPSAEVQKVIDYIIEKGQMPTDAWLQKTGLYESEIAEFKEYMKGRKSKRAGSVTETIARKTAQQAYKQGKKEVKDEVSELKEEQKIENTVKRLLKMKKSMSVDYQKVLKELAGEGKKINPDAVRKLSQWFDGINSDDIGMPETEAQDIREKLSGVSDKSFDDLTTAEKKTFADVLKQLKAHDRFIRKIQITFKGLDRADEIQRVLKSTVSLDAKEGVFREGTKEMYVKSLTASRVANMLDNFKDGGVNQEYIFSQFITENEAEYQAVQQTQIFMEKATAIKNEWTEEELQRITVNALDIMGAESQRDVLMEEFKLEEVPTLTKEENALMNLIEETMNENKQDIKAVFESRENQIFPEIARYIFPLKYEQQKDIVNADILRHDYHRTKESDDYFTEQRVKGVKKLIRTDLFNIVREGLQAQNWYFHMQPVLDAQASVLFSKQYKKQAGDAGYRWWKDQIDIVARRGYSAKSDTMFTKTDQMLKEGRINLNKAVMAYKASSAAMQIFSAFDAMAYGVVAGKPSSAAKIPQNIIKAWFFKNPELYKMSKAIQLRDGGEQAFKELADKGFSKWGAIGLKPLREADLRTALGVLQTYYDALGGTADKLSQAELMMTLSQGGTSITLRPHVLASGEVARTAFTFQTFFLNRWGLVAHDIINKSIIHGDARQKIRGANALAIIIMASMLEDDAREFLYSLITGKKYKDVSTMRRVFSALPETIPLVGRAISATIQGRQGDTDVPIVRSLKSGIKGAYDIVMADEGAKKAQGALKALEAVLSVKFGVPGTAQIFDLIESALPETKGQTNQKKAYYNRKIAEAYIKGDREKARALRQEAKEKGYKVSETSIDKHRKKMREDED